MSYRQCIFGVPTEAATREQIEELVRASSYDMQWSPPCPHIDVRFNDPALDNKWGLRLFVVACSPGQNRMMPRGYLVGYFDSVPLVSICHNDSEGVYVLDYRRRENGELRSTFLMSWGHLVRGDVEEIRVDYTQKGRESEFDALLAKEDRDLTGANWALLESYENAVTIGLRQFFPKVTDYLGVLNIKLARRVGWSYHDGIPPPQELPFDVTTDDWSNVVDYEPARYEWSKADLVDSRLTSP